MKPCILPTAILLVVSLPQMVHAGNYYWDTNGITAGFGAVGGITWNTSNSYWTTDSTGVATPAAYTTTTGDTIYFGTDTASYGYANAASAAVTVSGTQNVGSLYFGSQSGTTTLAGGTLNLAAASTITVNSTAATLSSLVSGAGTSLTKDGTGTLTLAASAETYSGPTIITGGTLKLSGAQTITSYTSTGTTSWTAPSGIGDVRYLVVGGGGGGGGGTSTNVYGAGGGGGAGGFLTGTLTGASGSYTVTVGGGGAAGSTGAAGSNGQNSVFGSNTAIGGGGGAGAASGSSGTAAATGGSGGGGSQQVHNTGGSGTAGQGNSGGNSSSSSPGYAAGGGGGAGAVGGNGGANSGNYGGNGGAGLSSDITGTTTWYAGGGGGATYNNANGQSGSGWLYSGLGGLGGGGKGGVNQTGYTIAGSGTANTGGGGGGGSRTNSAGAGGSGIVVLSYSYLASNVLPTTTALSIASGSSLDLNGGVQTVASLSDSGGGGSVINSYVGYASTLTVNPASGSTTFSGVIGGGGAAISVSKTGSGTQVLGGTNTYSGATAVNAGKLVVSGSIGSSAVTVSNAGTVLASGATGTIGNSVVVNNGAILAPGDAGAAGTATVNTATTFNNGSIFSWDINAAGTGYDKLVSASLVDGDAAGGSVLRIVASDALVAQNFWNTNRTWTDIITTDGSTAITNWANVFTTVTLVDSSFAPITISDGRGFSLSGNTLTWTAVPEPNTTLAGFLLGAGLLRRHRKCGVGTSGLAGPAFPCG